MRPLLLRWAVKPFQVVVLYEVEFQRTTKVAARASVAFKAVLKETGEPTTSCRLPYHPLPVLLAATLSLHNLSSSPNRGFRLWV